MTEGSWYDIFLTNSGYGLADSFVAPVMSVALQKVSNHLVAKPVKGGSNWLTLAFPGDASDDELASWRDLKVSDLIRVGTAATGSFTEYLTILETADVVQLYNTYSTKWQISTKSPTEHLPNATGGNDDPATAITHLGPNTGNNMMLITLRCVRVNHSIDATTLDDFLHTDTNFTAAHQASSIVTDATRGDVSAYQHVGGNFNYRENLYFPCYRQTSGGTLKVSLPTNIKMVRAVKLMGYSFVDKGLGGTQQQHEWVEDDWLAIRIKELSNNTILSNNRFAHGALHIVRTTGEGKGSTTVEEFEPLGIACTTFSPVNLPAITAEIVDRTGRDAYVGRCHLWMRILASHI